MTDVKNALESRKGQRTLLIIEEMCKKLLLDICSDNVLHAWCEFPYCRSLVFLRWGVVEAILVRRCSFVSQLSLLRNDLRYR